MEVRQNYKMSLYVMRNFGPMADVLPSARSYVYKIVAIYSMNKKVEDICKRNRMLCM